MRQRKINFRFLIYTPKNIFKKKTVIIQRNALYESRKIYTSTYRFFNSQQLFFYDIFWAMRILRVIGRQSIVYNNS